MPPKGKGKAPATANQIGAPSSKASSRKSKSTWRKAIDLSEVEAGLEEQRLTERLLGPAAAGTDGKGKNAEGSESALFTVDTTGDEQVAKRLRGGRAAGKRPLKSLEVLQSTSSVPSFGARSRKSVTANNAGAIESKDEAEARLRKAGLNSKAAKDKLRRLANKTVRGPLGGVLESEQSRLQDIEGVNTVADSDIWDSAAAAADAKGKRRASDEEEEEWIKEKRAPKVPKTMADSVRAAELEAAEETKTGKKRSGSKPTNHEVVKLSRTLPAVPAPHPGMSYNPDVESHESLVQKAFEVEKANFIEEEAKRIFKAQWQSLQKSQQEEVLLSAAKKQYLGMQVDEPASDSEEEEEEEAPEAIEEQAKKKEPKRKTKAQRARQKRAKEEQQVAQERKMMKQLRHLMTQVPAMRKELAAAEKARAELAEQKRSETEAKIKQTGMQGQRIGRNVVRTDLDLNASHVQIGEDLTENLRGLKTEGNLFRDRFQRMQTRAFAEPRAPVVAKRGLGTRGRKEYETHSYKRFV